MRYYTQILVALLCGLTFVPTISAQTSRPVTSAKTISQAETTLDDTNATPNISTRRPDSDVEALKQRLEEMESRNRALTQSLLELKARVDALSSAQAANSDSSPVTPTSQTAAAQASTPTSPADKNQPVRWSELIGEGNRIKVYGFLRLDLIADSQRPNNAQSILFVTSPDSRASGTDHGNFTMHPRLTRFGVDYSGPQIAAIGRAKLSGKLETDFQNAGTSESRQAIRIRHAYLNLGWKDFSLLAGQTWDTVSPLFPTVNSDTLQWNAGNVGDRNCAPPMNRN
jgi:hypothetical protein